MGQAYGQRMVLRYQRETTFKTLPNPVVSNALYFTDCDLSLKRILIESDILTTSRKSFSPVQGNQDVSGSIKTVLQAYQLTRLLYGGLGAVTTTGTNPYVHTIKVGSDLPSYIIELGFTQLGKYHRNMGCKINKMNFSIKPTGFCDVSLGVVGAKQVQASSSFDSSPVDQGYTVFTSDDIASTGITLDGSPIATITEMTIDVENGIDDSSYVINSSERYVLPEGMCKVSGNVKALFEDTTLLDLALAGTECALVVVFKKGTGAGSTGNEYCSFTISECKFSLKTPIFGPKGILVDLDYIAYYENGAGTSPLVITVKNTEVTINEPAS